MDIVEIRQKEDWKLFHQVPHRVYKRDANWITPLESDIEQTFDPEYNKTFQNGQARCFVLLDDRNEPAGRLAAFIDHKRNGQYEHPVGGIGFFECLNQTHFAHALFDKARDYFLEKNMEIMEGPINFGERDRFWGLLVHGFHPPLFQENYNPPYYAELFQSWEFEPFEQILTFKGASREIPFQRLGAIAQRLKERYPVSIRTIDYDRPESFARDFCEVYNASFSRFDHFSPLQVPQVVKIMEEVRPIADPGLICIAYYDEHPAGFIVLYPDVNQFLTHAKGKLNWWTLPLFLLKSRLSRRKIAKGMGFGIHPEFQSKGIFALLVDYLGSKRNLKTYPYMYLAGIRAHNKEIISIYDKLGVSVDRVHITYRKALLPDLEIKPFPFLVNWQ